jgi:peptidoglycan LD-endopeptidase LytH
MATTRRTNTLGVIGNIIVALILAFGAWLLWSNLKGRDEPPLRPGSIGEGGAVGAVVREAGSALAGPRVARRSNGSRSNDLQIGSGGMAVPVEGIKVADLTDTFTASRGGGSRVHNAIDIMAPEGRPVIAAAPGKVERLFNSIGKGGLTAYVRSEDGRWMYYYAHLAAYDASLKEGMTVTRGDPIGLVGHTGDASPSGPHLHFAINRMAAGERWWQGTPVNPYPMLAGKAPRR